MRGWVKLLVLALAAVVVTQLLVQKATPSLALGQAAPPLELGDPVGRRVDLKSLRGRVVLVNFWATWCPPCLQEIPELAEVWRQQRARCLEILGVAEESGSAGDVAEFARSHGIPYTLLHDPDGRAVADWKVTGYPRSYLVDGEGRLQRVFVGMLSRQALEEAVRPHLKPAGSCPGA